MNALYTIETAENGCWQSRMRDVSEEDSTEFIKQLIAEKKAAGYVIIDNRTTRKAGVILLQSPQYKPYVIRRIQLVAVQS